MPKARPASLFVPGLLISALLLAAPALRAESNAAILQQHYTAAQTLQHQGRLSQAAAQYRLFIADALGELAIDRARLHQYNHAAPLFDEALALAPRSPALQVEYAQAAVIAGHASRARYLARQILADYPDDPHALAHAHFVLGRLLFSENHARQARSQFQTAFSLQPSFPNGYSLAVACLALDDKACATTAFARLEKIYGSSPALHMDFGRAWMRSDFQPKAIAEFRTALAEDPHFPGAHYALAAALIAANSGANQAEAQAQLRLQLAATPQNPLAWAALGHLLAVQHRDAQALADLNRAIQLNASSPDAWLYLGELDFNSGRHTQAAAAFRRAIQLTKDPARGRFRIRKAHYLLGRILAAQGHHHQALAQMHIAQQLDQDSLSLDRRRMADFLDAADSSGRTPAAAAHAAAHAPSDSARSQPLADPVAIRETNALAQQLADPVADSFDNLGVIAASQKRFSAAAADFQQAAGWNAALPGLNKNWGRAAFYAGRFSDAIVPLARLVATQPRNQHYRAALGISQYMTGDYAACIRTLQPIKAQLASIPAAQRIYKAALVKIAAKQKAQ